MIFSRKLFCALFVAISACGASGVLAAATLAPYYQTDRPIVDENGRIRVIVDLVEEASHAYPVALWEKFDRTLDSSHPQRRALVSDFEREHRLVRTSSTTWVGASITAFLDAEQIWRIRRDSRVSMLSQDSFAQESSPLWTSTWNTAPWTERWDWGRNAVAGKTTAGMGNDRPKVYVIDGGVAFHDDLGSVVNRINVACPSPSTAPGNNCAQVWEPYQGTPMPGYYSEVGCYAHATHVAGIITATANNGINSAGVFAGVSVVSIATGTGRPNATQTAWDLCSLGIANSSIAAAFDFVYASIVKTTWGAPPGTIKPKDLAIISMSMNSGQVGYSSSGAAETNRSKLLALTTPLSIPVPIPGVGTLWYTNPGAVFVQSAGNNYTNSCSLTARTSPSGYQSSAAFMISPSANGTDGNDGIIVVGAIDPDALVPSAFPTSKPVGLANPDPGSNYGNCVDIWAPGVDIYSTWGWGPGSNSSVSTLSSQTYGGGEPISFASWHTFNQFGGYGVGGYSGWGYISGTSMAAPHVAAAAAYISAKYVLTTPTAIEAKVRQLSQSYGTSDPAGTPIRVVHLGP